MMVDMCHLTLMCGMNISSSRVRCNLYCIQEIDSMVIM